MVRLCVCCLLGLGLATSAGAHFVFVVPDKDGSTARVVFSDSLEPDENVPISKIAATKLTLRSADGKPEALTWKKGEHSLDLKLPGKGVRVVQGTTDYGISTREKDNPYLLRYHPRAIVGTPTEAIKPDEKQPVELIPVFADGKVRFLAAARGKPLANAEVNVLIPGSKSQKAKTDSKGLTETFDAPGRYGAWVRTTEKKTGELDGKKYNEVRSYATLVVDLPAK
jgi:uncharacterized GH25 family protein